LSNSFNSAKYKIFILLSPFLLHYMFPFDGLAIQIHHPKFPFSKLEQFPLCARWRIHSLHMLLFYAVKILQLKLQYLIFVTDQFDVQLLLLFQATFLQFLYQFELIFFSHWYISLIL